MYRQMMENITAGIARRPVGELDLPSEIEDIVTEIVRRLEEQLPDYSYRGLVEADVEARRLAWISSRERRVDQSYTG